MLKQNNYSVTQIICIFNLNQQLLIPVNAVFLDDCFFQFKEHFFFWEGGSADIRLRIIKKALNPI